MTTASNEPLAKPGEGFSSLFFTTRSDASPVGLATESFLAIMSHLGELDLVRASHVCANWRKAIVNCSTLWTKLDQVNVASMNSLDRVRAFASRSKGKLCSLTLDFEPGDLDLASLPIVPLLRQMFHEISRLDGARSLRKLHLDLRPYREYPDELEAAYKAIVVAVQFAEFSAVNLTDFKLITVLPRFPAGAPFWFSVPSLKSLVITSRGDDDGSRLPDFFSTSEAVASTQLTTSRLEKILLVNTSLRDVTYPSFEHLTDLKLHEMTVLNLYGLLSKCAPTLRTLVLRHVVSDCPSKYMAHSSPALVNNQKDVPPVLSLPRLKSVQISGPETPLLWVVPSDNVTSFMCDTPALERVDFGPKPVCKYTEDEDDDEVVLCAIRGLDSTVLLNLFRRSPLVSAINFKRTDVTEDMLISALPAANANLTHLSIGGSPACQDSFLDRLPTLLPNLVALDCYDPMNERVAGPAVSVQALARFVKTMTERPSYSELQITADEMLQMDPPADELRNSLKNLLVTLSTSQLSHLGSRLVLNPTPTVASFAASTLTFSAIKAELEELVTPPADPPFKDPFPAKPGERHHVKPETPTPSGSALNVVDGDPTKSKQKGDPGSSGNKGSKSAGANGQQAKARKKRKRLVSKIAAPQDVVNQAENLLQEWVTNRERVAAVAWLEEAKEEHAWFEITWGTPGCSSRDFDCCRAGGEFWDDERGDSDWDNDKGNVDTDDEHNYDDWNEF